MGFFGSADCFVAAFVVFGVGIVVSADPAVICVLYSGVLVIGDGLRCGGGGWR